jgi:hypothetical protein
MSEATPLFIVHVLAFAGFLWLGLYAIHARSSFPTQYRPAGRAIQLGTGQNLLPAVSHGVVWLRPPRDVAADARHSDSKERRPS